MIEWQEHSTPSERLRLAERLEHALHALHEAQREELAATKRLARQKKPENIEKAERALKASQDLVAAARQEHEAATRTMCEVHVDISLDDIVELVNPDGTRLREPIIVENVEFNLTPDGAFWMRIQGVLLAESTTGRPQLRQGFDLYEADPRTRIVKHN